MIIKTKKPIYLTKKPGKKRLFIRILLYFYALNSLKIFENNKKIKRQTFATPLNLTYSDRENRFDSIDKSIEPRKK